ncbi:beta strand repeat-containing protein [Hymenobacter terrestris]|uniref:T9SS type A sorting domain-containing protein n=1 Tax=Hymenobacter terrestris TaxID=2748310 RepID=A0ABX2Q094_9BACT|nr:T9SS type A sorting domain-containing protein [Hymenobacter terrestris]NVO83979.1 T9SS type A sorting domain-containing protein [Hymenobacter terrestris]
MRKKAVAYQQQLTAAKVAAACTNTTTLNFAGNGSGDWKNRAPVKAGAASTNTTIETAGSYVEPAGGAQTSLATGTYNAKTTLIWSADYATSQNVTTQIKFSFNRPVNNLTLTINDIDVGANAWVDKITYDAVQADGSVLSLASAEDATVTRNNAFVSQSGNALTGLQDVPPSSLDGTATVTFNKPITSLTLTYQNTITNVADPRFQFVAIDNITWCTQANVATTLSGPARANVGSPVTYTATTTASGDFDATGVKPVVQLIPGLNSQSPVFPAGSSYNNTTGLLTLATIPTLAVGTTSTALITFNMPSATVTGRASSTIDTDDADPSDNNGSLANANVTTTTNQAPTAQAKSAAVLFGTASITKLPAMTGTDPNNDPLTYTILGSTIVAPGFGVVSYVNASGTREDISGTSNVTLTAAQAATLEFKRGTGAETSGTFQYFVSDPFGGVSLAVNYELFVGDQAAVYSSPNAFRTSAVVNGRVLATVSDPDGSITLTTFTQTSGNAVNGGITFSANGTATAVEVTNGPQSGRISLPPAGTYVFSVTTTDSRGGQTISSVTITIVGTDRAATYTTTNSFNRDALTSGMTLATVTDPDAQLTAATLATGSTLPSGMSINGTSGLVTVGSSIPFAGTYTYNVATTDAAGGNSSPAVTITVFNDTEAIYAVAAAPTNGGYANGASLATVSDTDGAVNTATALSGTSALPPGVGLNPTTGQFFVADRTQLVKGTYPVQVRTTDATGGITTQTVNLIIRNNPLPVTLVAFGAQASGLNAQLNWKTAQELNNDYFVVERSFDGRSFVAVGEVKGQGSTQATTSYDFTDARVAALAPAGLVYYRLRQVDTDGTTALSEVRTVRFPLTARVMIDVYPNPATATQDAKLDLSGAPAGTYQVTLVDMTGRVLRTFRQNGGTVQELQLTNLRSGTYLVQVKGNGQSFSRRVVKQ